MGAVFIPVGMRTQVDRGTRTLVVNTCGRNDTSELGTIESWVWSNPTNRAIKHQYLDIEAVSVECLWQGCKLLPGQDRPDATILGGEWRKNKGKKPAMTYGGMKTPGAGRRAVYLPAFKNLFDHWIQDRRVQEFLDEARSCNKVYLRDFDTGQGVDRNGPMSHAWVLSVFLNTGAWPE
jgi:hypothetical protein